MDEFCFFNNKCSFQFNRYILSIYYSFNKYLLVVYYMCWVYNVKKNVRNYGLDCERGKNK